MNVSRRVFNFPPFRLAILFAMLLPFSFPHLTLAALIHVPADQPTIQAAINAAYDGDEIIVSPSTYYENIHFNGKNIILRSIDPTGSSIVATTIIDGSYSGTVVTFTGTEFSSCTLSGFTITNGYAYMADGAGILGNRTMATIQHNIITSNTAHGTKYYGYGGGIAYCKGAIQNNIITHNSAMRGGGICECQGNIQNNIFSDNLAGDGAGISMCDGIIKNNTISDNTASSWGGGLSFCDGVIDDNTITGNLALLYYGGGLYGCDALIQNNIICDNSALLEGGGFYYCHNIIQNNIICYNFAGGDSYDGRGGGLSNCDGTIRNNTIAFNNAQEHGAGIYNCQADIINCIICDNNNHGIYISYEYGEPDIVKYCNLYGNTPADYYDYNTATGYTGLDVNNLALVQDCISANPQFVDPENGDFHLLALSPCIDAGCSVTLQQDFEGDARPWDAVSTTRGDGSDYDIGADEFIPTYLKHHSWIIY